MTDASPANLFNSRCETLIKQGITVENVAMLYATAIKFSAEELEEFCFRFSLNHMVKKVLFISYRGRKSKPVFPYRRPCVKLRHSEGLTNQ